MACEGKNGDSRKVLLLSGVLACAFAVAATAGEVRLKASCPTPRQFRGGEYQGRVSDWPAADRFRARVLRGSGVNVVFDDAASQATEGRVLMLKSMRKRRQCWTGHMITSVSACSTTTAKGSRLSAPTPLRGGFGAGQGSCSVLGRTVRAIGSDIASWLVSPVDGARLGDL